MQYFVPISVYSLEYFVSFTASIDCISFYVAVELGNYRVDRRRDGT